MLPRLRPHLASVLLVVTLFASACGSTPPSAQQPTAASNGATTAEPTTATTSTDSNQPTASTTAAEPTAGSDAAATAQPQANAQGGMEKYNPPIELTTATNRQVKFAQGDDIDNNPITRGILDELGIKVTHKWILEGDEAKQKMQLAISSGDIPDLLNVDAVQLQQLVDADLVTDLTDAYNKEASPLVKQLMTADGGKALGLATINGKMMALVQPSQVVDQPTLLWVRTDWLKKLNLPEPKTTDDMLKIAEAFTTKDPDGNGKQDTVGFAGQKDVTSGAPIGMTGFYETYRSYPNLWVKDASGKLAFGSIQPETRAALQQLQALYKAGQLDPEFGSKDQDKAIEFATSGKAGMFFGPMWAPIYPLQSQKDLDANVEWKPFLLPTADGKPAQTGVTASSEFFTVVRKGYEHPEAAIKMLNMFAQAAWGGDPALFEKYMLAKDGVELHVMWPSTIFPNTKNLDVYKAVSAAITTKDDSKLNPEQHNMLDRIKKFEGGDNKEWSYHTIFGPAPSSYSLINEYFTGKNLKYNEFYGAATPAMTKNQQTLDTTRDEVFTRIIQGAPIEEFDKFVNDWKSLGGDQMTKEVNDWYASHQ